MNSRRRALARLKLNSACLDNPDIPRGLVLRLLVSMCDPGEAMRGEREAMRELDEKGLGKKYTAKELLTEITLQNRF